MEVLEGKSLSETRFSAAVRWLKSSTTPYLVSLSLTVMLAAYANYLKDRLDPQGFALFGQSPGIYLPFLLFPITFILWSICREHGPRNYWNTAFLGGLVLSWVVHFALIQYHGDLYVYKVWLFVPVMVMLWWKPPTWASAWTAIRTLAWAAIVIMALTMVLEKLGILPGFFPEGNAVAAWENERYWLPLQELFQLEGRWAGPFGYNSKTAFMAVFVIIVGLADKAWARWILVTAGTVALLLTGGRGSLLALAAGVAVFLMFARSGPISRIPVWIRLTVGVIGLAVTSWIIYTLGSLGLAGREELWSAYLDIWRQSMWLGVGQQGIANGPNVVTWMDASWMDAHSIYIELLTKTGLVGVGITFGTLTIGLIITLISAGKGLQLPAALFAVYLVAGITDLLHGDWLTQSIPVLLIVIASVGAANTMSGTLKKSSSHQLGRSLRTTSA
jgi:hypothetical protein